MTCYPSSIGKKLISKCFRIILNHPIYEAGCATSDKLETLTQLSSVDAVKFNNSVKKLAE